MNRIRQSIDALDKFEAAHPYASAIAAGALHFAASKAITHFGDKAGLSVRHGRSESATRNAIFEKHPVLSAIGIAAVVPIAEEAFWRAGPANLAEQLTDHPNIQRAIKLGALVLFAAQHAGKDGIPVNQAIGGAVYQHVYDKNGLKSSALAHGVNNSLAVIEHVAKRLHE